VLRRNDSGAWRLRLGAGSEKDEGWIGRDDRALIGAHEVAWILGREHKRAVVFADAPARLTTSGGWSGLEEKAELVDHEHAPVVLALDAGPQSAGEQ